MKKSEKGKTQKGFSSLRPHLSHFLRSICRIFGLSLIVTHNDLGRCRCRITRYIGDGCDNAINAPIKIVAISASFELDCLTPCT
jgi:hypothetical protein